MDTFTTVTKTSNRRAIDMPATYVATLTDGEEIFVESYGRKFVWDTTFPFATATVDGESFRPTSWTSAGAFIADLRGAERYWRQSAWFVNTSGDDENDGLTSATPVKTDVEIQRRCGMGRRARLGSPVTITYAQAPAGQTNYLFEIGSGGSLTLQGTPVTNLSGITITAVTAQVRTAGSEVALAITGAGLGAAHVGKLAVIRSGTAGNIGAYARVLKDNGGGSLRVSPFVKGSLSTFPTATQVTPVANVDVIDIITPTTLSVGRIWISSATNSPLNGSPSVNAFVTDSITLDGNSSSFGAGCVCVDDLCAVYLRTILKDIHLAGTTDVGSLGHLITGGGTTGTVTITGQAVFMFKCGLLNTILVVRQGCYFSYDSDTYFQASSLNVTTRSTVASGGGAFFDRAATGVITVGAGGQIQQTGSVPDWGTGNTGFGIIVQSGGNYIYSTKPTVNGTLGAGRETKIGGVDTQYASIPTVTAANNAIMVALA